MSDLTDQELDAIEAWCEIVLMQGQTSGVAHHPLTQYRPSLPTHSVRSTIVTLLAEVRHSRTRIARLEHDHAAECPWVGAFRDAEARWERFPSDEAIEAALKSWCGRFIGVASDVDVVAMRAALVAAKEATT
jgi:hypothetical protein